jgi:hypothetical protein
MSSTLYGYQLENKGEVVEVLEKEKRRKNRGTGIWGRSDRTLRA